MMAVKFEKDSICVDGRFVAADIVGNVIIQDDSGNLWSVLPVMDIDIIVQPLEVQS